MQIVMTPTLRFASQWKLSLHSDSEMQAACLPSQAYHKTPPWISGVNQGCEMAWAVLLGKLFTPNFRSASPTFVTTTPAQ